MARTHRAAPSRGCGSPSAFSPAPHAGHYAPAAEGRPRRASPPVLPPLIRSRQMCLRTAFCTPVSSWLGCQLPQGFPPPGGSRSEGGFRGQAGELEFLPTGAHWQGELIAPYWGLGSDPTGSVGRGCIFQLLIHMQMRSRGNRREPKKAIESAFLQRILDGLLAAISGGEFLILGDIAPVELSLLS